MSWTNQLKPERRKPIRKVIKKAKGVKKVGGVGGTTPDGIKFIIDQQLGAKFEKAKTTYQTWKSDTTGATLENIGITGGAGYTDKMPKKFTDNLYDSVIYHIDSEYQRANMPRRRGVKGIWKRMDILFGKTKELLTRKDVKLFETLVKQLKLLNKEGSKRNPRNIVFHVPTGAKKVGDKFVEEEKEEVFGHYRTKGYVEARRLVHNKKESDAVSSNWYSGSPDTAEPPLWQAMFAGSTLSEKGGDVVTKGLLGILEIIFEAIDPPPPPKLPVLDFKGLKTGKMEDKAEALSDDANGSLITQFKARLLASMKNPNNFKRGNMSHIIKYDNLLRDMKAPFRNVTISQGFVEKLQLSEFILDDEGEVKIKEVSFLFTGIFLNYAINKIVRGQNNLIMAPDGKRPFELRGSNKSRNSFSGEWRSKYDAAHRKLKESKVKKSWGYSLWR